MQHRQHRRDFPITSHESREISRERVGEKLLVSCHDGAPPRVPVNRHHGSRKTCRAERIPAQQEPIEPVAGGNRLRKASRPKREHVFIAIQTRK